MISDRYSRYPVNNKSPIITIKTPPIFINFSVYFKMLFIRPIKYDTNRNGKVKPSIYKVKYNKGGAPVAIPMNNIEEKIGPMQGVHPAAKPNPIKKLEKYPLASLFRILRVSFKRVGMLSHPAVTSPMIMISKPAIRWMSTLFEPVIIWVKRLPI